ncbi:MAG: GIY-YIG nuclease family protein [Patescibacteria group bacterium]
MFYIYILRSLKDNSLYIGYTNDLKRRFKEHNRKKSYSTRKKAPWILIHYEAYLNSRDATRREQYLKTSQGARLLKRILKEYFYDKSHK